MSFKRSRTDAGFEDRRSSLKCRLRWGKNIFERRHNLLVSKYLIYVFSLACLKPLFPLQLSLFPHTSASGRRWHLTGRSMGGQSTETLGKTLRAGNTLARKRSDRLRLLISQLKRKCEAYRRFLGASSWYNLIQASVFWEDYVSQLTLALLKSRLVSFF